MEINNSDTKPRFIHRHGGHVLAKSEPGKSTRFYFTLPQSIRESDL